MTQIIFLLPYHWFCHGWSHIGVHVYNYAVSLYVGASHTVDSQSGLDSNDFFAASSLVLPWMVTYWCTCIIITVQYPYLVHSKYDRLQNHYVGASHTVDFFCRLIIGFAVDGHILVYMYTIMQYPLCVAEESTVCDMDSQEGH